MRVASSVDELRCGDARAERTVCALDAWVPLWRLREHLWNQLRWGPGDPARVCLGLRSRTHTPLAPRVLLRTAPPPRGAEMSWAQTLSHPTEKGKTTPRFYKQALKLGFLYPETLLGPHGPPSALARAVQRGPGCLLGTKQHLVLPGLFSPLRWR